MRTSDFDFHLPEHLIAQIPAERREGSRLLHLNPQTGDVALQTFPDITAHLQAGDLLVLNDTEVINARLFGRKNGLEEGAFVEFLLLSPRSTDFRTWDAYAKPAKRIPPGTRIRLLDHKEGFATPEAWAEVIDRNEDGSIQIRLDVKGDLFAFLDAHGNLPLPPYIERVPTQEDQERYQTVYAQIPGAVAAPTAGLHFTDEILEALTAKGVEIARVTLHTGAGTFKPVTVDDVTQHQMHSEYYIVSERAAQQVNRAKNEKRRIIAVGTTAVRTLESVADASGQIHAGAGNTAIFLYPPYQMKVATGLLTNFHLPKSTLLMLVSCFATREKILSAYDFAVENQMRFYSYGDCMLIL